jgi:prephenate dehydrogenase
MRTIAIIGMGLIGTSLGLALRAADPQQAPLGAVHVVGYDQQHAHARAARGRLAIDEVARSLEAAVRAAQLVIIAVPVQAVQPVLADLAPLLAPGTVVTDVASTKGAVCGWARDLLPATVDFVGGHPMAGKEQAGPEAAVGELFQGAIYCLTPDARARAEALTLVEALVVSVGARPYFIDPAEHDAYVAGISHLPFVLSTALVAATSASPAWKEMAPLAASGFRDISRLASGDPRMHRDICLTNREALTRWINELIALLVETRESLAAEDAAALDAFFEQSKAARESWLASRPQLRPGEEQLDPPQAERPRWPGWLGGGKQKK